MQDAATTEAEVATPAAASYSTWERSWSWSERWIPHVLLAISTLVSATTADQDAVTRATTVALALVAGAWVSAGFTFAPPERRQRPRYALGYVVGLLVLATLLMARDPVFFLFAITGFLHSAILRPRILVFVGTGVTSFLVLAMTWEGGFPQPTLEANAGFLTVFVLQTVLIGLGTVGGESLHRMSEERRQAMEGLQATLTENEGLQAQLVAQAREAGVAEERQRLAREIHDTLAQGLIGIITQLEAAGQTHRDLDVLQRRLDAAARLARDSLTEARRSVHALGPGALEHGRLVDALSEIVDDWSQLTGIPAQLATDDAAGRLPTTVEVALVRVTQEALANVAKHADAARVGVTLTSMGDGVVLDVRDDGRGFDRAIQASDRDGFGLDSMRQRVAAVGGSLAVESETGIGTAISAVVPLPTAEDADA